MGARRTGKGKWVACCPAHLDKTPSLAIVEGKRGVLLKCMSQGCSIKDIVFALRLKMSDLFYSKPADRDTMRKIAADDERKKAVQDRLRRLRLEALEKAAMWNEVSCRLARLLTSFESDDRLSYLFNLSVARARHFLMLGNALDHPWLRHLGIPRYTKPIKNDDVGIEIFKRLDGC
jgi:hypothetical protein